MKICQGLGFTLAEIRTALSKLPDGREFTKESDDRIDALSQLRDTLSGCIGCGYLSLVKCRLYNPEDKAAVNGAGPHYLMGDNSDHSS